jgi:hypothetical protein
MKIRSGGGISEEMARALGASASSSRRLVLRAADPAWPTAHFPLESISSFKLGTVVKYATLFPGGYGSAFGFFMNETSGTSCPRRTRMPSRRCRVRR